MAASWVAVSEGAGPPAGRAGAVPKWTVEDRGRHIDVERGPTPISGKPARADGIVEPRLSYQCFGDMQDKKIANPKRVRLLGGAVPICPQPCGS